MMVDVLLVVFCVLMQHYGRDFAHMSILSILKLLCFSGPFQAVSYSLSFFFFHLCGVDVVLSTGQNLKISVVSVSEVIYGDGAGKRGGTYT